MRWIDRIRYAWALALVLVAIVAVYQSWTTYANGHGHCCVCSRFVCVKLTKTQCERDPTIGFCPIDRRREK